MEDNKYCYDNCVLINKLDIHSSEKLKEEESNMSYKALIKNIELFRTLDPLTSKSYKKIHKTLFKDIYEWAGTYRTINIGKEEFWFLDYSLLNNAESYIFSKELDTFENIIEAYNELNIVHPFREGNGRVFRVWLNLILEKVLKKQIDFSQVKKEEFVNAIIKGHSYDSTLIRNTFEKALVDLNEINYNELFLKNAITSYEYEGVTIKDKEIL